MPENVPLREADGSSQGGEVARVVFDSRRPRTGRCLGGAAPALVVENQLSSFRQRRERRPQQVVVEQEPAVHADERNGAGYFRREVHGEIEPACPNDAPAQARRSRARASKSDEAFAGGDLRRVETAPTK